MWDAFKAYGLGNRDAFETMNNQLFEKYIRRNHGADLQKFRVINGSGGDGGIEAYALLSSRDIIGLQSKWFRESLDNGEIGQIKKSILTAKKIRPALKEYIICISHDVHSTKIGRGKKPITNSEEDRINRLIDGVYALHPDLTLTWWFDHELLAELQHPDNEGVHKYWFEKEVITQQHLKDLFQLQMQNDWLKQRYIPDLHGLGLINERYQQMMLAKPYRQELSETLQEMINTLNRCRKQIDTFLATGEYADSIKTSLDALSGNLFEFSDQLILFQEAINTGNESFKPKLITEVKIWPIMSALENLKRTHTQKQILPDLLELLQKVHTENLEDFLSSFGRHLNERVKIIRGSAGGGKTHGLANCVEEHIKNKLPAVILPAKNTPCSSWTSILNHALELPGWTREEIFSALEASAITIDIKKKKALPDGKELNEPLTKALVCVDGLEEELGKETDWCSRVAEVAVLAQKYPRIRFLFSAREYFRRNCIDAYDNSWEEVDLPPEGDVPVSEVAEAYLQKYDITLEYSAAIKGLDSLLALRLFCEEYRGRTINSADDITTATRDLLRLKVDKINREFLASLQQQKSSTQQPIRDALLAIAEHFYYKPEEEHDILREVILNKTGTTLSSSEADLLLDFLARNGILVRYPKTDNSDIIPKSIYFYRITYQSIIEHILSEKIFSDIKNEKIETIPEILHHPIARPLGTQKQQDLLAEPPNQRITQDLVNRLFAETGKLIGENGFLIEGFSSEQIQQMKLRALSQAPNKLAITYKDKVDRLFFGTKEEQLEVMNFLIVPSCERPDSAFGAEYLHNILANQPSAFERDKLWSGLDSYEANYGKAKEVNTVKDSLHEYSQDMLYLSEFDKYNERPLLYAWALSNIDQRTRNNVRVALTGWAIKRPEEFLKLLDKVFDCNDPQIQEDLASVMLGVAGHLSDKTQLKAIAEWALKNVFENKLTHRNIIVRQGFRVAVERALIFGVVSEEQMELARPKQVTTVQLLGLEEKMNSGLDGEAYPIMHDLAWYVIERAYDNFLEYPSQYGESLKDNDCKEGKDLLDQYREKYPNSKIFAKGWAMAAAIYYIKNTLGLTRTEGNTWTDETHGGKSKIYTYEEKYTWLAVHYLLGYLSDYIPMGSVGSETRSWVEDYTQLTEIPNPGEEVYTEKKIEYYTQKQNNWVIKEDLGPTIALTEDIGANIKAWVQQEPTPDFSNWLQFDGKDFPSQGEDKKWQALYNHTSLLESSEAGFARLVTTACIIKQSEFGSLKKLFEEKKDRYLFELGDSDSISASPDTSTYSNPSDIVWMDWIKEHSNGCTIHSRGTDISVFYTITHLTQATIDGEKYYRIPSKLVRKMTGIRSFSDPQFFDQNEQVISFTHKMSDGTYRDTQEILLIDEPVLQEKLNDQQLQLFWIVEIFKRKNPLNKNLEGYDHHQKTRKYLVWKKDNQFYSLKYWDEYFSNRRDNDEAEQTLAE
jgi:hypothetical protein